MIFLNITYFFTFFTYCNSFVLEPFSFRCVIVAFKFSFRFIIVPVLMSVFVFFNRSRSNDPIRSYYSFSFNYCSRSNNHSRFYNNFWSYYRSHCKIRSHSYYRSRSYFRSCALNTLRLPITVPFQTTVHVPNNIPFSITLSKTE